MQHGHTRRAVLLAAVAVTGCTGRDRAPLPIHTDLSGRPFRYHDRCCDWEGTTITGYLPAVIEALGPALARPIELVDDDGMGPVHCRMGPPASASIPLLRGFYTIVYPPEDPPALLRIPQLLDTDSVRSTLAGVTDLPLQWQRKAPSPPAAGAAVVTDWVQAYRWVHRGRGRLVDAMPTAGGAFTVSTTALAPAWVGLTAEDPTLTASLREAIAHLRRDGELSAIRDQYFTAAGRPRRL